MKNLFVYLFVFILFLPFLVHAMANPAAIYCSAMNYTYDLNSSSCILPNGQKVPDWQFLQGKVAQQYSYCYLKGYKERLVYNETTCAVFGVVPCVVCVLPNGSSVEETKLMNLSFSTGYCGDGICDMGESYKNCPQDCPSGGLDGYCDRVKDGRCDPDCKHGEDPDCPEKVIVKKVHKNNNFNMVLFLLSITLIVVFALFILINFIKQKPKKVIQERAKEVNPYFNQENQEEYNQTITQDKSDVKKGGISLNDPFAKYKEELKHERKI